MPDYFALLEIPRRPLTDDAALKARFHELTAGQHPDVAEAEGEGNPFADLTVAYRTLSEPRTRLRHLLELEAPELSFRGLAVPAGVDRFFLEAGQRKQALDAFFQKYRAASSVLARALLAPEQYEHLERVEALLAGLTAERESWLARLPELDAQWGNGERPIAALVEIAQALGYLDRWIAQLREGLLELQLLD